MQDNSTVCLCKLWLVPWPVPQALAQVIQGRCSEPPLLDPWVREHDTCISRYFDKYLPSTSCPHLPTVEAVKKTLRFLGRTVP